MGTMKAAYYEKYGQEDVLTVKDVEKPHPQANELLVRVHAASINSWDWDMVRGEPVIVRMWGLFKPKYKIPGTDVAGTVEAVGEHVKKFRVGDDVFGDLCESGFSGFAEYVCATETAFALKPPGMTFVQASATPQAGSMALQSLRDKGGVKPGHKVLFNGAGGGVGTFGVQIAKASGAEVTVVDTGPKLAHLVALGADKCIDYRQDDFTENGECYDIIIDVVANRPISRYRRSLKTGGIFILIGGTMSTILQSMFLSRMLSKRKKKLSMLAYKPNKDLDTMSGLFTSGVAVPVIDKVFPIGEISRAFRYYAEGNFTGKIVITM